MLKYLVLIFVCAAAVKGDTGTDLPYNWPVWPYPTTNVVRCTASPGELPLNTHVEGCVDPPCSLPQLQDATINIVFSAPRVLHTMRTLAVGYLHIGPIALPVPWDLGAQTDTCSHLTNKLCPVMEQEVVRYTLKIFIMQEIPIGTFATLELRVVDEDNAPVFCIRMPFTIGPPVNSRTEKLLDNSNTK